LEIKNKSPRIIPRAFIIYSQIFRKADLFIRRKGFCPFLFFLAND